MKYVVTCTVTDVQIKTPNVSRIKEVIIVDIGNIVNLFWA